jgi:hypothetical protein
VPSHRPVATRLGPSRVALPARQHHADERECDPRRLQAARPFPAREADDDRDQWRGRRDRCDDSPSADRESPGRAR